jgi:hypothetical protein
MKRFPRAAGEIIKSHKGYGSLPESHDPFGLFHIVVQILVSQVK